MQASNHGALKGVSFPTSISLGGSDPLSQILSGTAIVAAIYFTMLFVEFIYSSFLNMYRDRVELFPNTYSSGSRTFTAIQNPLSPIAKTVYFSDNQRSGVEFTYAMFCYISSDTFSSGEKKLYHILHKGYSKAYPLMAPGVFVWGDRNCLRIFMNCYDTWNNYSDIENIPVEKWFHLVISCKGNQIYVYINGNLKQKVTLSANTPAYQNYGDVYLFSPRKQTITPAVTMSLKSDPMFQGVGAPSSLIFDGSAKGLASRVTYFSYAVTYTEIQKLMNAGPSSVMEGVDMSMSPYLTDRWWTDKQA